MSGLIPSTKFSLSTELLENPFPTLFLLNEPANLPLVGKAEHLKELSVALSNLETLTEDTFNRNHWGSVASGFSAAITISASASLVPVVGWILSGVSVVAAAASIGGAIHTKSKVSPVIETLKRHRLALESQEAIQWAALWELVGTDLFCRSLGYASRGVVSGGKLNQPSTDSPFMRAVDFIAECRGMGYEQVIASAGAIKNGAKSAPLPDQKPESLPSPSIGQNTKLLAIEAEVKPIEDTLTPGATKKTSITLFDFNRLRTEPDKFAHLRVIGGTGVGKTTFVDWLLDVLGGDRFVITPKKKSWNWVGLKVYGLWFDYETIRQKLQWIHAEMYRRYPLMEQGKIFELTNFVVDEWRIINTNVKVVRERDLETGQNIEIAPSAKAMMKDIITVARESMLRLIALAQGENVASWGFEGESDLEECFTDIRLGEFAIDHAKSLRNQCRKDSDDYEYWTAVLHELEWQNEQRTREGKSLPCCMVGKYPARIPDLTDWKREMPDNSSEEKEQINLSVTDPSAHPSLEATLPERKLPPTKAEGTRKPDGISVEAFSAKIAEALAEASGEASAPLFDDLDRDGKLLMLRLLLTKKLGKEKTILLAWGLRSGGRSHDKYKLASDLLDAMSGELSELGFNEENNWGVNE